MRNILIVIKHEIRSVLSKRSFWIMTFLFPLLILGLNVGVQVVSVRAFEKEEAAARANTSQVIGYVDPGGLVVEMPEEVPEGMFKLFSDESSAQAALEAGTIDRYFVVPADWVEQGEVVLVDRTFKPFGSVPGSDLFRYVLSYNLVGDEATAWRALQPMPTVVQERMAPEVVNDRQNPLSFLVLYATMFVFFFGLTMSSGLMLQSVSKEKETRTAEVLLLSLRPRQLMLGKLVGLGIVALFQLIVWFGGGMLFLDRGQQLMETVSAFTLPPGFIGWVLAYFVLGFAAYASVLAAVGVLAPTAREGAQFTFFVMLPLMIPLWMNSVFMQNPNGDLATFLSLFPPTAPLSMVTRLAAGGVPAWQPAAGLAGLFVMTYLFVLLSARLFRADTLLSSESLNWQRIGQEVRRGFSRSQ
jgi:ABC-2 type transport system permease protein